MIIPHQPLNQSNMPTNRLRSIVPMFGGGTKYVETLNSILEFVETHQPTTNELVEWHRETFANVSSRDSIMRRVSYLQQMEVLRQENDQWELGRVGMEYIQNYEIATLFRIMCNRNMGLRSLLYALSAGPMTIEEISDQQLDTHPELGWSREETDMANQRVNWLRSMELVRKHGTEYQLTSKGRDFVKDAVEEWAGEERIPTGANEDQTTTTYETVTHARVMDPEFRAMAISQYDGTCPVSGVDHTGLLDVAHVLPWSNYPDHRADPSNVLPLTKTHNAAFDRDLFTIDHEYRLQVNPSFETQSKWLNQTIVDRAGERIPLPDESVNPDYFRQRNSMLDWL